MEYGPPPQGYPTPGADVPAAPPGFRSASARSRVKGLVWSLGVLVGLIQLIVPVASVIWIIFVILKVAFTGPDVQVENAVWHQGRVWLPQRHSVKVAEGEEKKRRWRLIGIKEEDDVKNAALPDDMADALSPPRLVAGKQLWVLSSKMRGKLEGDAVVGAEPGKRLEAVSRPFVLQGAAAVLSKDDRQLRVQQLEGTSWSDAGAIGLDLPESEYPDDMVVVPADGVLHVFFETSDGDVMYGQGKAGGSGDSGFGKATTTGSGFAAGTTDGKLWLARVVDLEDWDRLEILEKSGEKWKVAATRKGQSAGDLHWIKRDGHAILVVGSALGGIKLMRFDGHALEEIASTGTGILKVIAWVLLPQLASLVLTVLFAFLVAFVLRGARVTEYQSDLGGDAEIASLLRRIVARLIDTALIILPLLVALAWALTAGGMDRLMAATGTGAQMVLCAWGLLMFGVMCAMEGHNGLTPGKAAVGIRVLGDDLQPCGVGRALLRNFLFAVDGMLMYVVGVMVIALSARQQRLGDMVAKTIVVRRK